VTKIAVAGAGRMGQTLARLVSDRDDLTLTAIWLRDSTNPDIAADEDVLISDDLNAVVATADVLIDFSLPEATRQILDIATKLDTALVCGVSGLDDMQMAAIDRAARKIPLLYDRNMSQGIAVLDAAIRDVVGSLGPEFSVEIHETHHAHKQDAPSGTALKLGDAVKEARRSGDADGRIHYESVREGDVAGNHSVILVSPNERLEFSHSVTTRDIFAEGALRAASWLVEQGPGRYSMQDVLFGD
jgi:4-hydroxy-tetrahydrodipicolinate reductase